MHEANERLSEDIRRVALITGGSGAIGSAVAEHLARRGENVVIAYHVQEERASELSERLKNHYGVRTMTVALDMSERDSIHHAVQETMSKMGRVDMVVHAAGVTRDKLLVQMKESDFADVIDLNVKGAFHLLQAVLPIMRGQQYGRIVNVTSYAGIHGRVGQSAYAASKAALIGLTKATALEVIDHGITVNAVAPSVTESAMTHVLTESERSRLVAAIPLGRMQTPEEAAEMIAWLTSEQVGTLTGQVFAADSRQYGW